MWMEFYVKTMQSNANIEFSSQFDNIYNLLLEILEPCRVFDTIATPIRDNLNVEVDSVITQNSIITYS